MENEENVEQISSNPQETSSSNSNSPSLNSDSAIPPKKWLNKKKIAIITIILIIAIISISIYLNQGSSDSTITGASILSKKTSSEISNLNSDTNQPRKEEIKTETAPKINEKLLLETAKQQNIEVNDSDVDNIIKNNLEAYKISEEELNKDLQQAGVTYEEFKEKVKSQLIISELINKNVDLKDVKVSDKEVDNFIDTNKEEFQDFFDSPDDMTALRDRVKLKLLRDKQTELAMDYINSLE